MIIRNVRSHPQFLPIVAGIGTAAMFIGISILVGSVEQAVAALKVKKTI